RGRAAVRARCSKAICVWQRGHRPGLRAGPPRPGYIADEELLFPRARLRAVPLGSLQRLQRSESGESGDEHRSGEHGRRHLRRNRASDAIGVEGSVLTTIEISQDVFGVRTPRGSYPRDEHGGGDTWHDSPGYDYGVEG